MLDNQDNDFLQALRARALYAGYRNSIVEWTVSEERLTPTRVCDTRGDRLARGSKVGMTGITFNEIKGEIPWK